MLTELRIRNLAVIDAVTLPLAPGFNVLSGETGAGKSIIVGALGLLLGERGSADVVRSGTERARVEGIFDCRDEGDVLALLDERGIEVEDGVVVLRREVAAGGKGRSWINGTPVTATILAQVGRRLVNLHGQHESQSLLQGDVQRRLLDDFAGAADAAARVRAAWEALDALRAESAALSARRDAAERRADYLRHVAWEIEQARPVEGEIEKLDDDVRRLAHAEELRGHVASALSALATGNSSAIRSFATARRSLAAAMRVDATVGEMQEALDGLFLQLEELGRDLEAYEGSLDTDPARLAELESRRGVLFGLVRKHGGSIAAVLETLREARTELELLDTADLDLRALGARVTKAESAFAEACAVLTLARRDASLHLGREVATLLPALGMPDGRFVAALVPRGQAGPSGSEDVEFRVALNVGLEERPLSRVASGGELSRVMLVLKTVLSQLDHVPTLVFDEVDSGIGGTVALQVGDALRGLSSHHQVFVVTHLAQIAARAHHHIVVAKGAREGVSTADIEVVEGERRVEEVARMLGGDPGRTVSRAHARELLLEAAGEARSPRARPRAAPAEGGRRRRTP